MSGRGDVEERQANTRAFPAPVPAGPLAASVDAGAVRPRDVGERRARILVVEDEAGIRTALVQLLGRRHEVLTVASAEQADALVEQGASFAVVLCDLLLPGISGAELHRRWRKRHPEMARRMIFMSGGEPRELAMLAATGRPVLEKPLLLAAAVRRQVATLLAEET